MDGSTHIGQFRAISVGDDTVGGVSCQSCNGGGQGRLTLHGSPEVHLSSGQDSSRFLVVDVSREGDVVAQEQGHERGVVDKCRVHHGQELVKGSVGGGSHDGRSSGGGHLDHQNVGPEQEARQGGEVGTVESVFDVGAETIEEGTNGDHARGRGGCCSRGGCWSRGRDRARCLGCHEHNSVRKGHHRTRSALDNVRDGNGGGTSGTVNRDGFSISRELHPVDNLFRGTVGEQRHDTVHAGLASGGGVTVEEAKMGVEQGVENVGIAEHKLSSDAQGFEGFTKGSIGRSDEYRGLTLGDLCSRWYLKRGKERLVGERR